MKKSGYRVTLSQNEKAGVSGMRIVKFDDINYQTERDYKPGYKLSEITSSLKITDIKQMLQENNDRASVFDSEANIHDNVKQNSNVTEHDNSSSVRNQLENLSKDLLKPTFTSSQDDLLKKRKWKFR
jgi:hypothetical protein